MSGTNLYRALRELLPEAPLYVGKVISLLPTEGASIVEYPGGGQEKVRGGGVALNGQAFVRDGVLEGPAPALTPLTIEV